MPIMSSSYIVVEYNNYRYWTMAIKLKLLMIQIFNFGKTEPVGPNIANDLSSYLTNNQGSSIISTVGGQKDST